MSEQSKPVRRVRADTIRRQINELLNWCASGDFSKTEIARTGNISRQLVIRANNREWDPPFSTIYALAKARDILLDKAARAKSS